MECLYITYDGITEPIPQSQGISYLSELSKQRNLSFMLLSFEKKEYLEKEDKQKIKEKLKSQHIEWYWLKYHKRPYVISSIYDIIRGMCITIYLVMVKKIGIIHVRSTMPALIAYPAIKLFRLKMIYDRRGAMADDYVDGGMWKENGFLYRLFRRIDKIFVGKADAVVVLTKRMARILRRDFQLKEGAPLEVIPCCVNLDKFQFKNKFQREILSVSNDKTVFVYSGSLGTWYMLDEMLDFFNCAKSQFKDAHFLILTMANAKELRIKLEQRGISRHDSTVLYVPYSKIERYLGCADIALAFIKPAKSKIASSPTKIGECLACGMPLVVNANIGDLDELIYNNRVGVVVKEFNRYSYNEAISQLKALLKEDGIRQRCRRIAEMEFDLQTIGIERYLKIYQGLINFEYEERYE